jgi:hypothetical protein
MTPRVRRWWRGVRGMLVLFDNKRVMGENAPPVGSGGGRFGVTLANPPLNPCRRNGCECGSLPG